MAYNLLIVDERIWRKDCAIIPKDLLKIIVQKIHALQDDPWPENAHVKQLKNFELADFRLRVGDYRVLFHKDEDTKNILLLRVLHRSKSYR